MVVAEVVSACKMDMIGEADRQVGVILIARTKLVVKISDMQFFFNYSIIIYTIIHIYMMQLQPIYQTLLGLFNCGGWKYAINPKQIEYRYFKSKDWTNQIYVLVRNRRLLVSWYIRLNIDRSQSDYPRIKL